MNAAAKALHQSNLFHGHFREIRFSLTQYLQMFLFLLVFVNAVVDIYCTNQYRMSLSQFEHELQESNMLELQWGQLLLEQASVSAPSYIQAKAETMLNMSSPVKNQIVVIRAL